MPEISVIVPVYRVEAYLPRCLDSLLAQTYTDWECILVDDGSPDRAGEICDEYSARDSRFAVIHRENGGLSAARNTGMKAATGRWFFFLDSDDWLHPEALALLSTAAAETGAEVAMCDYLRMEEYQPPAPIPVPAREELSGIEVLYRLYQPHRTKYAVSWGKIWRRELWEGISFPEGLIHEDEATTPYLLWKAERVVLVKAPCYCYYHNPRGIMRSSYNSKKLDVLTVLEARYDFFQGEEKGNVSPSHASALARATAKFYLEKGWEQCDLVRKHLDDPALARSVERRVLDFCRERGIWVSHSLRAGLRGETSSIRLRLAKVRDLLREEGLFGCIAYYRNKL